MKKRTLATLAYLILAVSCIPDPKPTVPVDQVEPVFTGSALMFLSEFSENSLRGERKYKGQVVEIWATASSVHEGLLILRQSQGCEVKCWFNGTPKELEDIDRGDDVNIRGRYRGLWDSSIHLRDCMVMGIK